MLLLEEHERHVCAASAPHRHKLAIQVQFMSDFMASHLAGNPHTSFYTLIVCILQQTNRKGKGIQTIAHYILCLLVSKQQWRWCHHDVIMMSSWCHYVLLNYKPFALWRQWSTRRPCAHSPAHTGAEKECHSSLERNLSWQSKERQHIHTYICPSKRVSDSTYFVQCNNGWNKRGQA